MQRLRPSEKTRKSEQKQIAIQLNPNVETSLSQKMESKDQPISNLWKFSIKSARETISQQNTPVPLRMLNHLIQYHTTCGRHVKLARAIKIFDC